jgi:hypothetical protein
MIVLEYLYRVKFVEYAKNILNMLRNQCAIPVCDLNIYILALKNFPERNHGRAQSFDAYIKILI